MPFPSVVFMDTRYAIALLSRQDQYHLQARVLAETLAKEQTRLMTTQAVFLELGAAFAKPASREIAGRFMTAFDQEPQVCGDSADGSAFCSSIGPVCQPT